MDVRTWWALVVILTALAIAIIIAAVAGSTQAGHGATRLTAAALPH